MRVEVEGLCISDLIKNKPVFILNYLGFCLGGVWVLVSGPCATHAGVYQNSDYPVLKLTVSKYPVLCFADLLIKYRKINGLYQEHLAEKLGVERTTIHNWETEKHKPDRKHDLSFLNRI